MAFGMHRPRRVHSVALICVVAVACSSGGGPGGGSEQGGGGGTAAILVGGPGGGSTTRDVETVEPDRLPSIVPTCPGVVRTWDRHFQDGDFEAVIDETRTEIEGDPETRALALLYNSLGRLYSSEEPAQVLVNLDRVALDRQGLSFCGTRGPVLHAEGSMFANAALGNFVEAQRELTAVAEIAPDAASDLQPQLDQLQDVVEDPSDPSESPTPETSSPTPTPSPTA